MWRCFRPKFALLRRSVTVCRSNLPVACRLNSHEALCRLAGPPEVLMKVGSMTMKPETKMLRRFRTTPGLLTSRLVLAACCVLTSMRLPAQNVVLTGAIGGRVTDQTGAVVPGASVVVRNLATGVQQSAETTRAGLYRFPVLMSGSYSVTTSLKGFRDVQALVRVLVGNTSSLDIDLRVGTGGDVVKVTGVTPLLRPEDSSASTVIDRSLIEALPLNGRKYTDFM